MSSHSSPLPFLVSGRVAAAQGRLDQLYSSVELQSLSLTLSPPSGPAPGLWSLCTSVWVCAARVTKHRQGRLQWFQCVMTGWGRRPRLTNWMYPCNIYLWNCVWPALYHILTSFCLVLCSACCLQYFSTVEIINISLKASSHMILMTQEEIILRVGSHWLCFLFYRVQRWLIHVLCLYLMRWLASVVSSSLTSDIVLSLCPCLPLNDSVIIIYVTIFKTTKYESHFTSVYNKHAFLDSVPCD